MDFDEIYKNSLGKQLTVRLAEALRNQEISEEELPVVANYILENIDNIVNHSQLLDFLTNLGQRWPIFSNILVLEKKGQIETKEKETLKQAMGLIKENKIDEAINIVKTSTEKNNSNT